MTKAFSYDYSYVPEHKLNQNCQNKNIPQTNRIYIIHFLTQSAESSACELRGTTPPVPN